MTQRREAGLRLRVRRGYVFDDGYRQLRDVAAAELKRRLYIVFVNAAGEEERGIDAGGLFKEFWNDLSRQAFDPRFGLFSAVEGGGNEIYPSPAAAAVHGSDRALSLFRFLGKILGKALLEGIVIQPVFAPFFLRRIAHGSGGSGGGGGGGGGGGAALRDLRFLDAELYKGLTFLKNYTGDATDLGLYFSVEEEGVFGGRAVETELIPGGGSVEVDNSNKLRYIYLMARHKVESRIAGNCNAFLDGLRAVVPPAWLSIFCEPELQALISGPSGGEVDPDDLRAHSRYAGGYTRMSPAIVYFWRAVESFDREEKAMLLRFVTSCERPPPLGFAQLHPPFTIQRIGISRDDEKLPSASTCFNILKLPNYGSEKVMRDKLLLSIKSGAGFGMS